MEQQVVVPKDESQQAEGQVLPADEKPEPNTATVGTPATNEKPPTPSAAAKAATPPPLATGDSRFMTLRRSTMKQMRAKAIKLFNKTPDRAVRFFPDEMAIHMACMAFEEVFSMKRVLLANHPPAVVQQHDPVQIFLQAFGALVQQMTQTEEANRVRDSAPQGAAGVDQPANRGSPEVGPTAVGDPGGAVRGDAVGHHEDSQAAGNQASDQPVSTDPAGTASTPA